MRYLAMTGLALLALALFMTSSCQSGQQRTTDNSHAENFDTSRYMQLGKEIAQSTFAALSGQLAGALERGGVPEAIEYCHMVAMPLVDSLSRLHNAQIRRTSLKIRNPKDEPDAREREVLKQYEAMMSRGESPKPLVEQLQSGEIAFYAPIHIKPLCLNCHGQVGPEVDQQDYELIKSHYPQDRAIGYAQGDLRGMWSITFQDKKEGDM